MGPCPAYPNLSACVSHTLIPSYLRGDIFFRSGFMCRGFRLAGRALSSPCSNRSRIVYLFLRERTVRYVSTHSFLSSEVQCISMLITDMKLVSSGCSSPLAWLLFRCFEGLFGGQGSRFSLSVAWQIVSSFFSGVRYMGWLRLVLQTTCTSCVSGRRGLFGFPFTSG